MVHVIRIAKVDLVVRFPAPDIEAEVRFLSTEEGGRCTPCKSGYRPTHDLGLEGTLNDAQHEFIDKEWVAPGETVIARLSFLVPELQSGRLHEGFEFTVQEGGKIVGRGRITKIFKKALATAEP